MPKPMFKLSAEDINTIEHTFVSDDVFFVAFDQCQGYALKIVHCTGAEVWCLACVDEGRVRLWNFCTNPRDCVVVLDDYVLLADPSWDSVQSLGSLGSAVLAAN